MRIASIATLGFDIKDVNNCVSSALPPAS